MRSWTRGSTKRLAATLAAYGLGVAGVIVATLITVLLRGSAVRGVLFVPAILLAAWYGGMGPGLFTAVLSVLAINFFVLQSRLSIFQHPVAASRTDRLPVKQENGRHRSECSADLQGQNGYSLSW